MTLRGRYAKSHAAVKMLQWLGLAGALMVVSMVVWLSLPSPQSTDGLRLFQLMQTLAVFLVPPLVLAYVWQAEPGRWLHVDRLPDGRSALAGVLLMVCAVPGINLLGWLNQQLTLPSFMAGLEAWMQAQEANAAELTERFMQADGVGQLLLNIGLMALLPALSEELTFRGMLQNGLRGGRENPSGAIWLTAIIFSAIHMQFYGFVPRMLIGALFGYALCWSGSLWLPVLMHFTNNALAVVSYYAATQAGVEQETVDGLGTGETLWLGVLSLCVTAVLTWVLYRLRRTEASI